MVADIEAIAEAAHARGIPLIVDNTLAMPYLLDPFDHGADVVGYSATKALAGHGNMIAGLVVEGGRFDWANGKFPQFTTPLYFLRGLDNVNRTILQIFPEIAFTGRIRALHLNYLGVALSPFDAYLTLINIETLSERVKKQTESALRVVRFLEGCKEVLRVKHPGAEGNPYRGLAEKYLPRVRPAFCPSTLTAPRPSARRSSARSGCSATRPTSATHGR